MNILIRLADFFRVLFTHRRIIARLEEENFNLRQKLFEAERASPLMRVPEAKSDEKVKPIRLPRRSFAEEQSLWEWEHNKRAQEIVARHKAGFF